MSSSSRSTVAASSSSLLASLPGEIIQHIAFYIALGASPPPPPPPAAAAFSISSTADPLALLLTTLQGSTASASITGGSSRSTRKRKEQLPSYSSSSSLSASTPPLPGAAAATTTTLPRRHRKRPKSSHSPARQTSALLLAYPRHLLAFLLTCKRFHALCNFDANPAFYARLFRFHYDVQPLARRFGPRALLPRALAQEYRHRAQRNIEISAIVEQHMSSSSIPSSSRKLADADHLANLWHIYLLLIENDGKNAHVIKALQPLRYIDALASRPWLPLYQAAHTLPPNTAAHALALHIRHLLAPQPASQQARETLLLHLRPFVFAAHKFDAFLAPWTYEHLPLGPAARANFPSLQITAEEEGGAAGGVGGEEELERNPYLADLTPRDHAFAIPYCGGTLRLAPPNPVHAACQIFFRLIELDQDPAERDIPGGAAFSSSSVSDPSSSLLPAAEHTSDESEDEDDEILSEEEGEISIDGKRRSALAAPSLDLSVNTHAFLENHMTHLLSANALNEAVVRGEITVEQLFETLRRIAAAVRASSSSSNAAVEEEELDASGERAGRSLSTKEAELVATLATRIATAAVRASAALGDAELTPAQSNMLAAIMDEISSGVPASRRAASSSSEEEEHQTSAVASPSSSSSSSSSPTPTSTSTPTSGSSYGDGSTQLPTSPSAAEAFADGERIGRRRDWVGRDKGKGKARASDRDLDLDGGDNEDNLRENLGKALSRDHDGDDDGDDASHAADVGPDGQVAVSRTLLAQALVLLLGQDRRAVAAAAASETATPNATERVRESNSGSGSGLASISLNLARAGVDPANAVARVRAVEEARQSGERREGHFPPDSSSSSSSHPAGSEAASGAEPRLRHFRQGVDPALTVARMRAAETARRRSFAEPDPEVGDGAGSKDGEVAGSGSRSQGHSGEKESELDEEGFVEGPSSSAQAEATHHAAAQSSSTAAAAAAEAEAPPTASRFLYAVSKANHALSSLSPSSSGGGALASSLTYDADFHRLQRTQSPFSSPGLPPLTYSTQFAGTWEGRFAFFDFDSYREMLSGRMGGLFEGQYGEQAQVWKLEEKVVRVRRKVVDVEREREVRWRWKGGWDGSELDEEEEEGKDEGETRNVQRECEDEGEEEIDEIAICGVGHSAWGCFVLKGRVRPWDGMVDLTKEYSPDGRGRWRYRGYLVAGERLVGRWRDMFSPATMIGYEGCFLMQRREGGRVVERS